VLDRVFIPREYHNSAIVHGGNVLRDIAKLRKMAGWSQYQVARATEMDRTRLSLIENGHVAPSADEEAAIERVLLKEIGRRNEQFSNVLSGTNAQQV
jgi:transcriptional regulator with XRE-family HTH domain